MRVRILTIPPLPHVKAWFEIPSFVTSGEGTIESLKTAICEHIFDPNDGTKFHYSHISLEIDQYELLDHTSAQVVRENDLIEIKISQKRLSGVKRKREQYETQSFALKGASHPPISTLPSDSTSSVDSASSSSTSTSSTSESSTESPSSDTDSEKTSEKSFSSIKNYATKSVGAKATALPTGLKQQSGRETQLSMSQPKEYVPPGDGKRSTKQRNLRRRRKRLAAKGTSPSLPAPYPPSILPGTSNVVELSSSDPLVASMTKLTKNSNKKKGFKESMKNITSNHKIFENQNNLTSFLDRKKSFLPPSQRSDLPVNIIVTSVDVESGFWNKEGYPPEVVEKSQVKEDHTEFVATQRAPLEERSFWEVAEANWEIYPTIQADASLSVDMIVMWKDLVLNPRTFTPELVLRAVKILEITEDGVQVEEITRDEFNGGVEQPLSAMRRTDINGYRICT